MIVGGVDLGGRKAAVSILDDGVLTHVAHLELPRTTRTHELRTLADWVGTKLRVCDFVCVEEPLIGRGVRASLQVAQAAGAVLATVGQTDMNTRLELVPVSTWKKEVVGSGNASKQIVGMWLKSSHPAYAVLCGENQDRIDAVCIGLYAAKLIERAGKLEDL